MAQARKIVIPASAMGLALLALWLWCSMREEDPTELRRADADINVRAEPEPAFPEWAPLDHIMVDADTRTPTLSDLPSPPSSGSLPPAAPERLEVQVVEATLEPVPGINVILERGATVVARATDARGLVAFEGAEIEHLDAFHPLRVCVQFVPREPNWVAVDHLTRPGQPLHLFIPPHGKVDVEVFTLEGQPVEDAMVELRIADEAQDKSFSAWPQLLMSAPVENGHARFQCVDLDLHFELFAESLFGLGRAQAVLDGPKFNGELVSHTLVLGLDRTILLFRALDEGRQPIMGELQASV